jgi:hypothetical protein
MASASDFKTCDEAGIRVGELTPAQRDGLVYTLSQFLNSKRRSGSKGSVNCMIYGGGGTGKTFLSDFMRRYFEFVFPEAKIMTAEDGQGSAMQPPNESCDAVHIGISNSALPIAKEKELPGVVYVHLTEKISKAPKAQ